MSKIASLKKKAADLEKKSPDKAIPVYAELLSAMEKEPSELDIALFNRVGDLLVKSNRVGEAVDYYERAVDHYVDGGFFNNAIALCNKILRASPGRSTVYYKLGKISAHKGFKADAKQNFLEYADRMQKAGQVDEAFRALGEFADLCPDQTDIRLMLADQLSKANKNADALEQLQILHQQLDGEGRAGEAEAAAERIRALDPSAEPRRAGDGAKTSGESGDLIFLDLSDSPQATAARRTLSAKRVTTSGMKAIQTPPPVPVQEERPAAKAPAAPPKAAAPPPPPPQAPPPRVSRAAAPAPSPAPREEEPPPEPMPDFIIEQPVELEVPTELESPPFTSSLDPSGAGMLGFEGTSLSDSSPMTEFESSLDIESTSLVEPTPPGEPARGGPSAEAAAVGSLDFIMPDADPVMSTNTEIPVIDGMIDLDLPDVAAPADTPVEPVEEVPLEQSDLEDLARVESMRPSMTVTAKSIKKLQKVVDANPEDWASHRELAEALLETGDRDDGLRELETAMLGYERSGDLSTAMSVADEIVRIDPSSVKHHQKRVEYSYRTNDRAQLVESYLSLADALFRSGQVDKSRTIYQRVLELSPDDIRAQAALSTMPEPAAPPPPAKKTPGGRVPTPKTPAPLNSVRPTPNSGDAFVNLGDMVRDDDSPKDTRMVVAEEEPTGNEEADFADMLKKFKQGVAENVEAEDYQSHYDLGVAYKEMGLVDEAIAEFQKALRGPANRVRTYEAIGQCFIEKGQNQMAATILARALSEKDTSDEQLVGVLYLLGRANEALGKTDEAVQYYQRVFIVDIGFHDVSDRLSALENAPR
jgi:tetratricopeptide (TPR) repeat protein